MNAPTPIVMDVNQHAALPFPQSLPEFQRLFPDDMARAAYLEKLRWQNGFVCPHCRVTGVPFYIATRPGVLTCRKCRRQTGLTVGTVMERSHTTRRCPLGFGPPTWSPAKLPACRLSSCNANLGSRSIRQLFRFSTSWTKAGSAAGHAARVGAFTTKFWSPAPLRCAIGSLEPRRISEGMDAMRAGSSCRRLRPKRKVAWGIR
jgi:hypothetical protein